MPHEARIFVGIDWGNEIHHTWVTDGDGAAIDHRRFEHSGAGLTALAEWLVSCAAEPRAIIVAIEVPRGPIVETLLERGCQVWAINPKQLDRFRDRYSVGGAKDDRRDARVLAQAARTDPSAFRPLDAADPLTAQLRECSRHDAELAADFGRVANRLRELLLRAWPEVLRLAPAADAPWLWTLLARAPTPDAAAALRPAWVRQLLRRHHIRRWTAEDLLTVLRTPSVHLVAGTREGIAPRITDLVAQLEVLHQQRRAAERRLVGLLDALTDDAPPQVGREHPDAVILQSLPGIGIRITGTMLAEAADMLRRRDYHALRTHTGIAPVTKQSGKTRVVQMRLACNGRLRDAMFCWGRSALRDPHVHAHYTRLRAGGHSHARALRGVVDRLLKVLIVLLTNGQLYDATRRPSPAPVA